NIMLLCLVITGSLTDKMLLWAVIYEFDFFFSAKIPLILIVIYCLCSSHNIDYLVVLKCSFRNTWLEHVKKNNILVCLPFCLSLLFSFSLFLPLSLSLSPFSLTLLSRYLSLSPFFSLSRPSLSPFFPLSLSLILLPSLSLPLSLSLTCRE